MLSLLTGFLMSFVIIRSPTSLRSRGSRPLDLSLLTLPTLRERVSLRRSYANAERVLLGLSAYVFFEVLVIIY